MEKIFPIVKYSSWASRSKRMCMTSVTRKWTDLVKELRSFGLHVDVTDPKADDSDVLHEYGFHLDDSEGKKYDAILLAVPHKEYAQLTEAHFLELAGPDCIFIDIKGVFRNKMSTLHYWSL